MRSKNTMTESEQGPELEIKSKSQKKREMHALQKLGEQLIQLSDSALQKLALSENLLEALAIAKSIKKHGALKRQIQYIGRLMRDIDAQPIIEHLALLQSKKQGLNHEFRLIEEWRDRLLSHDHHALDELFSRYPYLDKQHIRTLIRNALTQTKQGKSPKAARALFTYLSTEINNNKINETPNE